MPGPHFTPSTDPAFPLLPEEFHLKLSNGTNQVSYQDVNGRFWIEYYYPDGTYKLMTTDSGDPSDLTEWREAEPEDGEPISRSTIYQQDSRPLEETTPLFGPQEPPAPEPDYDPWDQPREGHWDPVGLRWVYDEPTMKSAEILDDDHTHTLGESGPETSSVGKVLGETPWDKPRGEGDVDSSTSSVGKVLDDTAPTTEEGGAGGGVDPSAPFDPDTTPTGVEGTAAAPPILETPPEQGGDGGAEPTEPVVEPPGSEPTGPPDPWDVDPSTVNPPHLDTADGHKADLDEEVAGPLRSGHWDPAALRYVDDGPSTTVEGIPTTHGHDDPSRQEDHDGSMSQRDGNANGIPNEYGDGPDLDGNGVPDEIGINPDILQPGYSIDDPGALLDLDAMIDKPPAYDPSLSPGGFDKVRESQQQLGELYEPNPAFEPNPYLVDDPSEYVALNPQLLPPDPPPDRFEYSHVLDPGMESQVVYYQDFVDAF